MSMIKYRVHEVAKDFGLSTKTITEILKFLLLFSLRTDHEEPHHHKDKGKHDPHRCSATLRCRRSL